MNILEYIGLDTSRCKAQYRKVVAAIERDDFQSADVKKLASLSHGKFYRAKLDYANRLLFTVVRHGDKVYALMLEVIENHAYDKSRFLNGAAVDDDKIPAVAAGEAAEAAVPVRYVHPERRKVHLLDKAISFDDAQEAVYQLPAPLIVVGSAGSGKTALALEKMKHAEGEILYVTHSAYLAQSARNLYYAHGFERAGQDATFLSYREFLETLRVPAGREATWRDFAGWFSRMRQQFKDIDAHQAFEEIRGVIAADAAGVLSREAYRGLGVRQSIFPEERRDRLYELFDKYRAWLEEAGLYDLNLVAHAWRDLAQPCYDFALIDEVQDFTNAQLALVLRTLRKPDQFLLCGDSNQIVHPNFFSWSRIKSLFWRDEQLAERQDLQILRANFRNSLEATRVANTLLKIKHRRFGSIDRESNFLVRAVAGDAGQVATLSDKDSVKKELDRKTRSSTRFAVLVMRDEDKAEAKKHFHTPLIFSIHEAKGLEYENIVLYRFVSDHRAEFSEIAEGVSAADLEGDGLDYRRAKDKADKSLEIYKFYVNAFYVALTRATQNVYLVESDSGHVLLGLLGVRSEGGQVQAKASSLEDWQKEARKLELQGKQEQADAIRQTILKQAAPPWTVFDEAHLRDTLAKVFREQLPGNKLKLQLYEYAACYDEPVLAGYLAREAKFEQAKSFYKQRATLGGKYLAAYHGRNVKEVLRQCEQYGVEHRTAMNQTPLMAAAAAGNIALVEALLERGADPGATDHLGRNALHWAMLEAFRDEKYARGAFAAIYGHIAPAAMDFNVGERLVRIDRHLSEYFLLQTLWVLFKSRFAVQSWKERCAFDTGIVLEAWEHLPANVLKPERNKRSHLSSVLSRNEVDRDYAYNRRLFKRQAQGWYRFNPALAVRRGNAENAQWLPIYRALNLQLVKEFAEPACWHDADDLLADAGAQPAGIPIAAERMEARRLAEEARIAAEKLERERRLEEMLKASASVGHPPKPKRVIRRPPPPWIMPEAKPAPGVMPEPKPAPWGTPQAKRQALEQLRREIEEKERRKREEE